jgi:chitinase
MLIFSTAAHHDKKKRDLEVEVDFNGDHKAWLEHTWRKEKRSLNHVELHKRWWSGNVREWWDKQREVDVEYTGIRHRVYVRSILHPRFGYASSTNPLAQDKFDVKLFEESLNCPQFDWLDELYFRSWATLLVDIQTSAGVTLIVGFSIFASTAIG